MTALPSSTSPNAPAIAAPASQWLLALSLLLIALNLRPVFGSLSVVLPEVMRDTGLSSSGASWLTTLPILCLGLFCVPTPALARRFGMERVLLAALTLIATGTLLRAAGSLPMLFASAVLAGAGIAMSNVLLPTLIKRSFARQTALMMGLYTLALCAGASAATALTVPMEMHWFDGAWPYALAFWALPAVVAWLVWVPQAARPPAQPQDAGSPRAGLLRNALAWQVTLFMGLQSALAYMVMGWLAPILRERGIDSATAGYLVAISILMQLVASLFTPPLAARLRGQSGLALGLLSMTLASFLGLLWGPVSDLLWLWAVVLGLGQGGTFALALSIIVMRSGNAQITAQLSAMAQGWGYTLAAFGPLLVGMLRGITGSYLPTAWLVIALSLGAAVAGWGAGRNLLIQPDADRDKT
ncbi:CynX/NimT family MFS transporter [Comamonas composti]|uniref:CynX/NimT family MFS transporter n=1 Tax=Comamonas composti TaxID=408558 RepID=UPI001FE00E63|nr:MFS transporter [Comamonas composti]